MPGGPPGVLPILRLDGGDVTVPALRRFRQACPGAAGTAPGVGAGLFDQTCAGAFADFHDAVRGGLLVLKSLGNRQNRAVGAEEPEPDVGLSVRENLELSCPFVCPFGQCSTAGGLRHFHVPCRFLDTSPQRT